MLCRTAFSRQFPDDIMDFVLVGYQLKRSGAPDGWRVAFPAIEELCSVSSCLASVPERDPGDWSHNDLDLYNSETAARAQLGKTDQSADFDLFAYRMLPLAFSPDGRETHISLADIPHFGGYRIACDPLGADYTPLGFDCVQTDWRGNIAGLGCSPLSCNGMAHKIAVNRFCLIDGLGAAYGAARLFARDQPEPGTYYVFEVWRKHRGTSAR